MEQEAQQVLFYWTHIDKHLPVGSLARWDRGTGLDWVGGKRTGAEATFRAAKGTYSLHGNTGVSACLTWTLLFTPIDRRMLASDTEAKNKLIPQATMGQIDNGSLRFHVMSWVLKNFAGFFLFCSSTSTKLRWLWYCFCCKCETFMSQMDACVQLQTRKW